MTLEVGMDNATTVHEPTIANADLWTHYFEHEWGRWLTPFGGRPAAEGAGARVASLLALVAAGPIAWLYNSNERPAVGLTPVARSEQYGTEDVAAA
jgi:hypothetical protein